MSKFVCFLVTLYYSEYPSLIRVAVRVDRDKHPIDWQFPMASEVLAVLASYLPLHASVDSIGPIVEVTEIFEVVS